MVISFEFAEDFKPFFTLCIFENPSEIRFDILNEKDKNHPEIGSVKIFFFAMLSKFDFVSKSKLLARKFNYLFDNFQVL